MAELVGDVVNAHVPEIYGETAGVGSPYKLCDLGQFLNLSLSFLVFKMEIRVHNRLYVWKDVCLNTQNTVIDNDMIQIIIL